MQTRETELGYWARPDALRTGVVVIHDVWGLSDHYRDLARRLADAGHGAVAVNLYRREPAVQITDPGRFIRALDDRRMLEEIQAGIDFLTAEGCARVAVMGCCMGGQYTLLAAAGCSGLSAAVAFYGMLSDAHGLLAPAPGESIDPARKPRTPLAAAPSLRCPTLAFFGAEDAFIPLSDVCAFESALGSEHRVVVYPGAGHAFLNDTRQELYRPEAARDAWSRMLDWLEAHLGS